MVSAAARSLSGRCSANEPPPSTTRTADSENPEVAKALRGPERDVLNEIEDYLGSVDISSDPRIFQEQFDFAFI